MANYLLNLSFYVPELVVIGLMIVLLFIYAFAGGASKKVNLFAAIFSTFVLLTVAYLELGYLQAPLREIFSHAVVIDPFSTVMKFIMILGTLGVSYMAYNSADIAEDLKFEFMILSQGVLVGAMLLASSINMLTIYIGLETMSIISYALAALKRNSELSSEAGLKYVLYGGLASGVMLFGMSYIYGTLGTIYIYEFPTKLATLGWNDLAILIPSFLFFFVGLGYKISTVPFHMWTPDVYEGSPVPVTTFFALIPKIAGLTAVFRLSTILVGADTILAHSWIIFISLIGAITMTAGNVAAIGQRSVKRMLAYSSISHAGFMLLAVLVVDQIGASALVFYGIIYLFMTLVAFMVTGAVADRYGNDYFDRFRGLINRYPLMALAMLIVMLSLAGVPPFAGFVAKFNILAAIIQKKYYGLAVIAGLNSVVSLYYYMKIVRLMTLKEPESTDEIVGFSKLGQLMVVLFTVPVVLLGIFWESVLVFAHGAQIFMR